MSNDACERLDRIERIVTRIDEAIYGNGNPGIKTEVALNTEFRKRWESVSQGVMVKVVGAIIISNVVVAGIVWVMK